VSRGDQWALALALSLLLLLALAVVFALGWLYRDLACAPCVR
jgi:hypothetical protein